MKKVILVLVLFVGLTTHALAQRGTGSRPSQTEEYQKRAGKGSTMTSEERIAHKVEQLTKELSLTEKQQVALKSVLEKEAAKSKEQMAKNREAIGESREQMRKEMAEERQKRKEETDKQVKKILTAEQQKVYDNIQAKRQSEMRGQAQGKRPNRR